LRIGLGVRFEGIPDTMLFAVTRIYSYGRYSYGRYSYGRYSYGEGPSEGTLTQH